MYEITSEGRMVLSRTWMIFFERLRTEGGGGTGGPVEVEDLFWRTLLLKDTAVDDDIADHVPAQATGTATKFVGVLRLPIESNLVVRVNKDGSPFCTLTIPALTGIDSIVETTAFADDGAVSEGDVFSWDVLASDGQVSARGVASFTLYFEKTSIAEPVTP